MRRGWIIDRLRPLSCRGKKRLLDRFVPPTGVRTAVVEGVVMHLDLSDVIQREMYLGAFERAETKIMRRLLRKGDVMVDVGANAGHYAVVASRLVGSRGRVFAIEPSPYAYEKLERLKRENPMPNVTLCAAGLSDHRGELDLYVPPAGSGNHSPTMVPVEGATRVRVPVRTFDDCMEEWKIQTVHLLKLDVEGHEPLVLRGAVRALRERRILSVLVEFNDRWLRGAGSNPKTLWGALIDAGFREVGQHGEADLVPGCVITKFMRLES